MVKLDSLQLIYLLALFYGYEDDEQMSNKYYDLLDCYKDDEVNQTSRFLIENGYMNENPKNVGSWLTPKGYDYVFKNMPFDELWALYRDGREK